MTRTRRRSTGGSPRRTTPSSERCIGSTRSASATSRVPRRQSNPRVAVSGLRVAGVPEESTVRRVHARADRRRLTLASPVGTLRGDGDSAFTTDGVCNLFARACSVICSSESQLGEQSSRQRPRRADTSFSPRGFGNVICTDRNIGEPQASTPRMYAIDSIMPGSRLFGSVSYSRPSWPL